MKHALRRFLPLVVLLIAGGALATPFLKDVIWPPATDGIAWRTDYQAALAEAKATGKPLLLDFSASWCPPCKQMKQNAWPTPAVRDLANGGFIPVQLDVDRDDVRGVAQNFRVDSIPRIVVLSADGATILANAQYLTPEGLAAFLKKQSR